MFRPQLGKPRRRPSPRPPAGGHLCPAQRRGQWPGSRTLSGTLCTLGAARCAAAECRVGAGPAGGARAGGPSASRPGPPPRLLGGPPPPLGVREGRDRGADPRRMTRPPRPRGLRWSGRGVGGVPGVAGWFSLGTHLARRKMIYEVKVLNEATSWSPDPAL